MPEHSTNPAPAATSAAAGVRPSRREALALAGSAAAALARPTSAQPGTGGGSPPGGLAAPRGFIAVPDWFSQENEGAGIAVTDLPATGGQQHLAVLMVDGGPQQNRGLYRLGRNLDANGTVTGGWTPWVDVPDWFSWENQGAGVAVTPPDAQGRRDLVVFMVDNGPQQNRGVYRLGKGLDADGNVAAGWTDWTDVPGWFSWENQGAGIAVADLGPGGERGLLAFQIDGRPTTAAGGLNQAFFKIGTGLGADGAVAGWGQHWQGVPHWFSWENQGGAAAVARIGGRNRLLVLMVDSPPGQNAGHYQIVDLEPDPALHGRWDVLPFPSRVLGVHAAQLPSGDVLFFAGSGGSAHRFNDPIFGDVGQGVAVSVVWNPPGDTFVHPDTLRTGNGKPYDLFCGGDAFLPDGRMLSAGGTIAYPFQGRKEAAVFDATTRKWTFVAPMGLERWYPSVIALGDGRLLAASGLQEQAKKTLETYSAATNAWQPLPLGGGFPGLPLYAHLLLIADGRVFFSGGRMDDPIMAQPCAIDLTQNPALTQPVGGLADPTLRNQSTSVILPPAQGQRVMVCGGGPSDRNDLTPATEKVGIVDLRGPAPAYAAAAPMALPRMHHNAVLLPDRTVFVCGGSSSRSPHRWRGCSRSFTTPPRTRGASWRRRPYRGSTTPRRCCWRTGGWWPPAETRTAGTPPRGCRPTRKRRCGSRSSARPTCSAAHVR